MNIKYFIKLLSAIIISVLINNTILYSTWKIDTIQYKYSINRIVYLEDM